MSSVRRRAHSQNGVSIGSRLPHLTPNVSVTRNFAVKRQPHTPTTTAGAPPVSPVSIDGRHFLHAAFSGQGRE